MIYYIYIYIYTNIINKYTYSTRVWHWIIRSSKHVQVVWPGINKKNTTTLGLEGQIAGSSWAPTMWLWPCGGSWQDPKRGAPNSAHTATFLRSTRWSREPCTQGCPDTCASCCLNRAKGNNIRQIFGVFHRNCRVCSICSKAIGLRRKETMESCQKSCNHWFSVVIPFSNFIKKFLQLRFWRRTTVAKPMSHNLAKPRYPTAPQFINNLVQCSSMSWHVCHWATGIFQFEVSVCCSAFVQIFKRLTNSTSNIFYSFSDATPQHMFQDRYPHSAFAGHGNIVKHSFRTKAVAETTLVEHWRAVIALEHSAPSEGVHPKK